MLREKVDMFEIVKATVQSLEPEAESADVSINMTGEQAVITGVPQLLGGIVYNLCDNAIKYNHKGGRVSINLKSSANEVLLTVSDNGMEFTKRLAVGKQTPTMFENTLQSHGIQHKLIRPFTPRHNGKVERSHRKDNEYFYATHTFYSFADFAKQLKVHNYKYNKFPMRPLNWKAPIDYVNAFLSNGEIF